MAEGKTTTDHQTIRQWVEEREGVPARVQNTGTRDDPGILRLDFEPHDASLEPIAWEAFFHKFESAKLAFLYQERTDTGEVSRFHKFIDRESDG